MSVLTVQIFSRKHSYCLVVCLCIVKNMLIFRCNQCSGSLPEGEFSRTQILKNSPNGDKKCTSTVSKYMYGPPEGWYCYPKRAGSVRVLNWKSSAPLRLLAVNRAPRKRICLRSNSWPSAFETVQERARRKTGRAFSRVRLQKG